MAEPAVSQVSKACASNSGPAKAAPGASVPVSEDNVMDHGQTSQTSQDRSESSVLSPPPPPNTPYPGDGADSRFAKATTVLPGHTALEQNKRTPFRFGSTEPLRFDSGECSLTNVKPTGNHAPGNFVPLFSASNASGYWPGMPSLHRAPVDYGAQLLSLANSLKGQVPPHPSGHLYTGLPPGAPVPPPFPSFGTPHVNAGHTPVGSAPTPILQVTGAVSQVGAQDSATGSAVNQVVVVSPKNPPSKEDESRIDRMESSLSSLTSMVTKMSNQFSALTAKAAEADSQQIPVADVEGISPLPEVQASDILDGTPPRPEVCPSSETSQQIANLLQEVFAKNVPINAHSQSSLHDLMPSTSTYAGASQPPVLSPQQLLQQRRQQAVPAEQLPSSVRRPAPQVSQVNVQLPPEMSEDPLSDEVTLLEVPLQTKVTEEPLEHVLNALQPFCPESISTQITHVRTAGLMDRLSSMTSTLPVITHQLVGGENIRAFLEDTFRLPTKEEAPNDTLSKKASFLQPTKKRLSHLTPSGGSVIKDPPLPAQPTEVSSSDSRLRTNLQDRATTESKLGVNMSNKSVRLQERTIRDTANEFAVAEGLVTALMESCLEPSADESGQISQQFRDMDPDLFWRVCRQLVKVFANISHLLGTLYANVILHKRDAFMYGQGFLKVCSPLKATLRRDPPMSRTLFADHSSEVSTLLNERTQRAQLQNADNNNKSIQILLKQQKAALQKQQNQQGSSSRGNGRGGRGSGRQSSQNQPAPQTQQPQQNSSQRGRGGRGRGQNRKRPAPPSADAPAEKKQSF